MSQSSALSIHQNDSLLRLKVIHFGRRTTISIDSFLFDLLSKKAGGEIRAINWIRDQVAALPVISTKSPSLSRRTQKAIVLYLVTDQAIGSLP